MHGGGGQGRNRTADTRIFSPLLYRLSYLAGCLFLGIQTGMQNENYRGGSRKNAGWSGRRDSNSRPLAPEASALPSCATPRRVGKRWEVNYIRSGAASGQNGRGGRFFARISGRAAGESGAGMGRAERGALLCRFFFGLRGGRVLAE